MMRGGFSSCYFFVVLFVTFRPGIVAGNARQAENRFLSVVVNVTFVVVNVTFVVVNVTFRVLNVTQ